MSRVSSLSPGPPRGAGSSSAAQPLHGHFVHSARKAPSGWPGKPRALGVWNSLSEDQGGEQDAPSSVLLAFARASGRLKLLRDCAPEKESRKEAEISRG